MGVRMRKSFPGHYAPSDEELKTMLRDGTIVLDTNVLLDLYKFTPSTREHLLHILEQMKEKLWIPYHVGKEYQRNRSKKIEEQIESYANLVKAISAWAHALDNFKQHPFVNHEQLSTNVRKFAESQVSLMKDNALKQFESEDPSTPFRDECEKIHQRISNLFDGKVGNSPSQAGYIALKELSQKRYASKMPPGYKDSSEKGNHSNYGDAIIWLQLLEKGRECKGQYIFVTGEKKDDWWHRSKSKEVLAPRKELIEEMMLEAGCQFWLLQTEEFITHSERLLGIQPVKSVLTEMHALHNQNLMRTRLTWLSRGEILDIPSVGFETTHNETLRLLSELTELEVDSLSAVSRALDQLANSGKITDDFGSRIHFALSSSFSQIAGIKPKAIDIWTLHQHLLEINDELEDLFSMDLS